MTAAAAAKALPPNDDTNDDESNDELIQLLTDRRLVRATSGKLASSHIVGQVVSFFSDCCLDPVCPRAAPFEDV